MICGVADSRTALFLLCLCEWKRLITLKKKKKEAVPESKSE